MLLTPSAAANTFSSVSRLSSGQAPSRQSSVTPGTCGLFSRMACAQGHGPPVGACREPLTLNRYPLHAAPRSTPALCWCRAAPGVRPPPPPQTDGRAPERCAQSLQGRVGRHGFRDGLGPGCCSHCAAGIQALRTLEVRLGCGQQRDGPQAQRQAARHVGRCRAGRRSLCGLQQRQGLIQQPAAGWRARDTGGTHEGHMRPRLAAAGARRRSLRCSAAAQQRQAPGLASCARRPMLLAPATFSAQSLAHRGCSCGAAGPQRAPPAPSAVPAPARAGRAGRRTYAALQRGLVGAARSSGAGGGGAAGERCARGRLRGEAGLLAPTLGSAQALQQSKTFRRGRVSAWSRRRERSWKPEWLAGPEVVL